MPQVCVCGEVVGIRVSVLLAVVVPRGYAGQSEVVVLVDLEVISKDILPLVVVSVCLFNRSINARVSSCCSCTVVEVVAVRADTVELVGLVERERSVEAALECKTLQRIDADVRVDIYT